MERKDSLFNITYPPESNPFRQNDMIHFSARAICLPVPRCLWKKNMTNLDDWRDDPGVRNSVGIYKPLLHFLLRCASVISKHERISNLTSSRELYGALLFFELCPISDMTKKANEEEKENGAFKEPNEFVESLAEETADDSMHSDNISVIRFWLFNQSKSQHVSSILVQHINRMAAKVTKEAMDHLQSAQLNARGEDSIPAPVQVFADEVLNSISQWQIHMYSLLEGDPGLLGVKLNNISRITGQTPLNPEIALNPTVMVFRTAAQTEPECRTLANYYNPRPYTGQLELAAGQEVWRFFNPKAVWLVPPAEYKMFKLVRMPMPFKGSKFNRRALTQNYLTTFGLPHSLLPEPAGSAQEDDVKMREQMTEIQKKANRVKGRVMSLAEQSYGFGLQVFVLHQKAVENSMNGGVNKLKRRRLEGKTTNGLNYHRYKARHPNEDDDAAMAGDAEETDEPDASEGESKYVGNDPGAERVRHFDALTDAVSFEDDPLLASEKAEKKRADDDEEMSHEPIVPPDVRSMAIDEEKAIVEGIPDMTYMMSSIAMAPIDPDDEHEVIRSATVLNEFRQEFARCEQLIRSSIDQKKREEGERALHRDKIDCMDDCWSTRSKLSKVHTATIRWSENELLAQETERALKIASLRKDKEYINARIQQMSHEQKNSFTKADGALLHAQIIKELKSKVPKANFSNDCDFLVRNLSAYGNMIWEQMFDQDTIVLAQDSHLLWRQVRISAFDASRYGFGLHRNMNMTGRFGSGKSRAMKKNAEAQPPGTYEFVTHQTAQSKNTSGDSSDLVTYIEELDPKMVGIEGKDGSAPSSRAGFLKNQLTSQKNTVLEFFRTKNGARTTKKSTHLCQGTLITAMNKYSDLIDEAINSRMPQIPTAHVDRKDRKLMDVVGKDVESTPEFIAWQKKEQIVYMRQLMSEKFLQAGCIRQPTMFVAEVLLRCWVNRLAELGIAANDPRIWEQMMITARVQTIYYGHRMAYDSVLSSIRNKQWEPKHHREIIPWLFCTEDICMDVAALSEHLFISPVENALHREFQRLEKEGKLQPAYNQRVTPGAPERKGPNGESIPAIPANTVNDPDPYYWQIQFTGSLREWLSEFSGRMGEKSFPIDDMIKTINHLCTRPIKVSADVQPQGLSLPAARIDTCMKKSDGQLRFAKQFLKHSMTDKFLESFKVFSYSHARERTVLIGRSTRPVQYHHNPNKFVEGPQFLETIRVRRDPKNVLHYYSATGMNKTAQKYAKDRAHASSSSASFGKSAKLLHTQNKFQNIEQAITESGHSNFVIRRELDCMAFEMHAAANAFDMPSGEAYYYSDPRATNMYMDKHRTEESKQIKYVYPDDFIPEERGAPVDLDGEILSRLRHPKKSKELKKMDVADTIYLEQLLAQELKATVAAAAPSQPKAPSQSQSQSQVAYSQEPASAPSQRSQEPASLTKSNLERLYTNYSDEDEDELPLTPSSEDEDTRDGFEAQSAVRFERLSSWGSV